MSPNEAVNLDAHLESTLWQAIPVLEAQEMLKQMRISLWPHMTKEARSTDHRQLFNQGYPRDLYPPSTVTMEEYKKSMGAPVG